MEIKMKFLAALLVLVSTSAFAYEPAFEIFVSSEKTITLNIGNDSDNVINCSYSMSWFENTLKFKRFTGTVMMNPWGAAQVNINKDISANVTFLKAKVDCK